MLPQRCHELCSPTSNRTGRTVSPQHQRPTARGTSQPASALPAFEQTLTRFLHDGRERIAFEETRTWPALHQVLTAEQAHDLGDKLLRGRKIAPTRPHPHTPPEAGVLKTAGPAVAADRLRDAVSGRGDSE
jgi:hypothetical protein